MPALILSYSYYYFNSVWFKRLSTILKICSIVSLVICCFLSSSKEISLLLRYLVTTIAASISCIFYFSYVNYFQFYRVLFVLFF